MKTVANLFATTYAKLGADHQQDRHFITIERLPPDEDGYCTFLKSVEGVAQNEYWIAREKNILMLLKKTPHVVRLRREEEKTDSSYQTVRTRDAGITLAHWLRTKPQVADGDQTPPPDHPFTPVGHFLALARYSLLALKQLHLAGVVHANLRADNICIPYAPFPYHHDTGLRLDFENLTLIDFMFAVSNTLKLSRSLPLLSATGPSTQSALLRRTLDEDRVRRNGELIQRLDYSVDLFALGFILEQIFQQNLIYPGQLHAELSMEIHQLIAELKSFDDGIPAEVRAQHGYSLPHDAYLRRIDHLLALDPRAAKAEPLLLHFDPGQFLEEDVLFASDPERLESPPLLPTAEEPTTEKTTMKDDPVSYSPPAVTATDDDPAGYIELDKSAVIILIITGQLVYFVYTEGKSMSLDELPTMGLLLVIGLVAAFAGKLFSPKPAPRLRPTVIPSQAVVEPVEDVPVVAQPGPAPVAASEPDELDRLAAAELATLTSAPAAAASGDVIVSDSVAFTQVPAEPVAVVPVTAASVEPVSTTDADTDAFPVVGTPGTPDGSAAPMADAPVLAAQDTDAPAVAPLAEPVATPAASEPAAPAEPVIVLLKPSSAAPQAAETDKDSIELNKWAVIAAIIAFQIGFFLISDDFTNAVGKPSAPVASTEPAPAVEAPAEPVAEAAPVEPPPAGETAAATDAAPAANIALLDEVTSVQTPQVSSAKAKKATDNSMLLSGSPAADAPRPAKKVAAAPVPAPAKPAKVLGITSPEAKPEPVVANTAAPDEAAPDTASAPATAAKADSKPEATAAAAPAPAQEAKPNPATKSLTRGLAEAQNTMGWHYYQGDGVKRDYEEAFRWFQKAANLGEPNAQFNVGMMYAAGTGTKQDFAEAAKWYKKAAEQGKTSAQLNLGMMYISGRGIRQNINEGVKWLNKAADQGDATARANLTWLTQQGYVPATGGSAAPAQTTASAPTEAGQ